MIEEIFQAQRRGVLSGSLAAQRRRTRSPPEPSVPRPGARAPREACSAASLAPFLHRECCAHERSYVVLFHLTIRRPCSFTRYVAERERTLVHELCGRPIPPRVSGRTIAGKDARLRKVKRVGEVNQVGAGRAAAPGCSAREPFCGSAACAHARGERVAAPLSVREPLEVKCNEFFGRACHGGVGCRTHALRRTSVTATVLYCSR
jgi:hypothetical protein